MPAPTTTSPSPLNCPSWRARARRSSPRRTGAALIEVGPLSFDTVGREVRANGQRLALSVRELSVLEMLMARVGRVVTKRQIVNSLSAWDADFSENAVEVYVPPAQAPGRHRRQHPDGAWFRLYAGCRSGLTADRGRLAPAATILPPTLRAPGHDAGTHSSRRRSGLAPAAPLPFLARHLVIRLMPPILLLVLLDLIATWVITHKIEMSMWMLEDFLWLMVLGQIVLIVMFTWVVVQGVRSGLRSVNHLSEEIRQRSIDDMQPLEVAGVPVEIEPLVTHTNDRAAPGRLAGGAALHRPCGPSVAHAAVRPAAGVRADAGAAAAGRCARAGRAHQGGQRPHDPPGPAIVALARADPNARPQDSFVRVDLCEWVRSNGAEWFPAREARHELDLVAPDTPIWIDADPLLLAELLGNLIDNALRYGNETGRIVLIVGANPPSLTVEDDGPGIPPKSATACSRPSIARPRPRPAARAWAWPSCARSRMHGAWWRLTSRPDFPGTRLSVVFPAPKSPTHSARTHIMSQDTVRVPNSSSSPAGVVHAPSSRQRSSWARWAWCMATSAPARSTPCGPA